MRWIIGDIHGMLRPLTTLVGEVRRVDPDSKLIFVGDYVNRGPDAKGVIDYLLGLTNAVCCRGNHDDIFDLVVNGTCYADNAAKGDRASAFQWFIKYGLDNTFLSYGCDYAVLDNLAEHCSPRRLDDMVGCVPEAHRHFIHGLAPGYEDDDLFVLHGKWEPDDLAENPGILERLERHPRLRHKMLWGRYTQEELVRTKAWRRTGYFGHTPVSFYANPALQVAGGFRMVPVMANKVVLVDTAAALGTDGRLTAYCPDDGRMVQADHYGALLGREI